MRVDALPNIQASLAMADSFGRGEAHWYLYRGGLLGLGVHVKLPGQSRGWRYCHTPPVFTPDRFGLWTFVATVCDGKTGQVTHYVNGRVAGQGSYVVRRSLRLDTFEIGNWGVPYKDPRWPSIEWGNPEESARNLHGRIDEFAILKTPLTAEDIHRLYREGRPGETMLTTLASQ